MTNTGLELHVSLDGNDAWSGTLAAPDAERSDGPLRTFEAAQAAVRRCRTDLQEPAEIRVWVHDGVYELAQPLLFTAQDSGFPRKINTRARTWPVTWAAAPGATPVISGGRRLTGTWSEETINGHQVWAMKLPEVAAGRWNFRQLWVNGQRRLRPRLPKQGVWQVERALDARYSGDWGSTGRQGTCRFGYAPGQISAGWRNLRDVEVQFFGWWVAPRARLTTVDEAERIAWFDRYSTIRLAWAEGDGIDFRLENVFEALSEPGEWYLDRPTGTLYYMPMPGEKPSTTEFVAPRLETLLRIDGASNIRFEGLTFAHNEWREPDAFADSNQASHEVPGALILHRADTCVFHGCRVLHSNTDIVCRRYGGWCAYTDEGSSDVLIESNLCYRANREPFHQHYGRNNVVRNNILAYGGESLLAYGVQEEHVGVIFECNILLSDDKPFFRNAGPERWTPRQTRFHRNLYWCESGQPQFGRDNNENQWAEWQPDNDPQGVMADPLFVDPHRGDFRLRPGSPALAMGFVPFDISQCGPRPRPGSL